MTEQDARARLAGALRDDLVRADAEAQPIPYETLEAYVDGALDEVDREIVETRLADDGALRAEVEELSELRRVLAASGAAKADPAKAETTPARTGSVVAFPSAADRASRSTRRWVVRAAPWLAAAAAVVVVVWTAARWRPAEAPRQAAGGRAVDGGAAPAPSESAAGAGGAQTAAGGAAPSPSATAKLRLRDGERIVTLASNDTVAGLDQIDPAMRAGIAHMLATGRLPDVPRDLAAARGQLLGPAATSAIPSAGAGGAAHVFAVRAPVGSAVRDARPLFAWTAAPGAASYRVHIVDASLDAVADSDRVTATSWRPDRPLPRGRVLQWQVEAETAAGAVLTPVPPAPEALFRVLTTEEAARVDRDVAAAGGSTLAAAWILARAGLRDEAAAALDTLAAANSGSSTAEQALLQRLRAGISSR